MSKTLGILGGGQLGRMSAQAAQKLGIRTVIFTPEDNSPASQVADETVLANYDDEDALRAFADKVDVISYEFENIPVKTVRFLQTLKPVYPDDTLLEIAQDRLVEKSFLNEHGIPTANWSPARSVSDIEETLKDWNTNRCIIKTTRFGYDGKGQAFIRSESDIQNAWDSLKSDIVIIEEVIDFDCEISVIVARDQNGHMEFYGPCLNDHANHILSQTTVPADIPAALADKAIEAAANLATAVNLVGVLALEMFVTKDGRILANEIAPRTHNSGHWTIDACAVSQFENHVRTVCGMDAAPPARHSDATMLNLIGDEVTNIAQYEAHENAHIHLYGKDEVRPGRKMGHVTILKDKTS
ncbi:MAG: 5-(carboxyamino)imidazole ribonucleotide synthase [Alphaproteobacteria bacterium]|nr:5-(carboxyamino)imidazole ribonucleotide synthase [Alphaproteobacteria bacterium]